MNFEPLLSLAHQRLSQRCHDASSVCAKPFIYTIISLSYSLLLAL
jgi:hypothetical protein